MNRYPGSALSGGLPFIQREWYGRQAPQASAVGDQLRFQFVQDIYALLGDTIYLWMPDDGDTTTSTDFGRRAAVWTYDGTIAGNLTRLGSGLFWELDGTADEVDTPDIDAASFGNSTVDNPISVVVLARPDNNTTVMTLMEKGASATDEEWELFLDASGHLNFQVQDESVDTTIEGRYAAGVGTSWTLLGASYSGSGVIGGMTVFTDGVSRAVTDDSVATYVAMENGAGTTNIGARYSTKARFFDGGLALGILVNGAMSADEHWALKSLVNSYYDLAL